MNRRQVLAGLAVGSIMTLAIGINRKGPKTTMPSSSILSQLNVGHELVNVPTASQGIVSVYGRFPQVALQSNPEAKYNGFSWYAPNGRRVGSFVADITDQDLSLYTKAESGVRKAFDLDYSDDELNLRFQNMGGLFVSGSDATDGDTTIGIAAGTGRGDSILRFVNENGECVWSIIRDTSTDENLRLYNSRIQQTAFTVETTTNTLNLYGNSVIGLREIANPAPDDLYPQEWAWDSTQSRWLYRTSNNTVNYFEPDGTL